MGRWRGTNEAMRRFLALVASTAVALGALTVAAAPARADEGLVVWIDASRAPALEKAVAGGFRGVPVTVVPKDMATMRDDLAAATPDTAPDVLWADSAWTGQLVNAGSVVPVGLSAALRAKFATAVIDGFRIGTSTYGVPVQFENVALVTNAQLVPAPVRDFAALEKAAYDLIGAGQATVGIAVAQGAQGNAYFMNPLYSGLGGAMFGVDAAGSLVPSDVRIANPVFLANAKRINAWNRGGLIDSALDVTTAEQAFTSGKAPFWITGPWSTATLNALPFAYRLSPVPAIVPGLVASPYVGTRGFMVTKAAADRGRLPLALGFVRKLATKPRLQEALAAGNGTAPRTPAIAGATGTKLAMAFGNAAKSGIPVPNIPQASAAWGPLGKAWASATKGQGAVKARPAFTRAQREVRTALGQ